MLHWYMTNAEYRIFEPPELQLESQVTKENDFSENQQNDNTLTPTTSIIGTIAGGLTRSLSAVSKRGRSKSLKARPITANNYNYGQNILTTLDRETNNLAKPTTNQNQGAKKESVYLN